MKDTELGKLMALLLSNPGIPLKFYLDDISINQGYHVTEVKHASVKSMDCAKRTDAWDEILIQLLDGEAGSTQGFMNTSIFMSIVSATLKSLPESSKSSLFFEFAPNNGPLQKLRIRSTECDDHNFSVHLTYEKAVCKPLRRWGRAGVVFDNLSAKLSKSGCCSGRAACCA